MKLVITPWKQKLGMFGFEDNTLVEANICDISQQICIGDIFLARVNKLLPGINACFVQLSNEEEAFLPFDETNRTLKSGEYVLVQIKKVASKGKQPLVTTRLSLSGLYCVVNYESHSIQISSKLDTYQRKYWKQELQNVLETDEISASDKELLLKYCLIVRTNVSEVTDVSEVVSEWISLAKKLDYIVEKGIYQGLFSKIYCEEKPYLTYIRDLSQENLDEIIIDNDMIYNEIKNEFKCIFKLHEKIRLYQDDFPVSKLYSIESKLEEVLSKKVWLKCGGFLVIEPTEALTVIDVNSGKFEKNGDSEAYYKKINEEAAVEIARQLKIRNVSGIIIIDFINMSLESNQKALLELLAKHVAHDRIKTHVVGMTSLGLVEMTRAKVEKPLWEQIR